MPMTANGLAKLIEESGELLQVAGKRLAYYRTERHPDGGPPLSVRMEEEIGDVMAACTFYAQTAGLNLKAIALRREYKEQLFRTWHELPANNRDAIDGPASSLGE